MSHDPLQLGAAAAGSPALMEMARLHRLLFWQMVPLRLPASARAGESCVGCARLLDGTAVELELPAPGPQRGCRDCYGSRVSWYITWYHWHHHYENCLACQRRRICFVGRGWRTRHERTTTPAGQAPTRCYTCPRPLHAADAIVPVRWDSGSMLQLGYGHAGCVSERSRTR
ncbi:hypothetical protein [Streptomyces echinatus]|uniref:hypothetical protein n=1 Tax=Streptomyces echinatus TaxID=67293 RepID=UPI003804940E